MARKKRITVISIFTGIVHLIEPDGTIRYYRQRGIDKLTPEQFERCVRAGILRRDIMQFPELPRDYAIEFDDPEIMGKAHATFKMPKGI